MSGWLLDNNILSAFAPGKRIIPQKTADWFSERSDELFLSTITAAEKPNALFHSRRFPRWEKHRPYYSNVVGMVDEPAYRHVVVVFNVSPFDVVVRPNVQQVFCPFANLLHSRLTGPMEPLGTSDNRPFDNLRSRRSE